MSDTVPVVGRIYSFRISSEAVLGSFASAVSPTPSISSLAASCPPSPAQRSPNSPHAFKNTPGRTAMYLRGGQMHDVVLMLTNFHGKPYEDPSVAPKLTRAQLADILLTVEPWAPILDSRKSIQVPNLSGGYILLEPIHVKVAKVYKCWKKTISDVDIDDVKYMSDLIHARENAILEAVKSARLRKRGCSQKETVHHGDTTDDGETTDDETPAKRHQVKKFFASSTATLKEVGAAQGTSKDSEPVDADWNSDDDGWSSDGSAEDDTCLPYIDLYEDLDIEPDSSFILPLLLQEQISVTF